MRLHNKASSFKRKSIYRLGAKKETEPGIEKRIVPT